MMYKICELCSVFCVLDTFVNWFIVQLGGIATSSATSAPCIICSQRAVR